MTIKEAIRERHSVRQYKDVAIKAEDKERLEAVIKECNAESGLHLQLMGTWVFGLSEIALRFAFFYPRFASGKWKDKKV